MQNFIPKIYCYVDDFNLSDLSKLGRNINIIYRNYENIDRTNNILKIKSFCKKNGNCLYLSNDLKLSLKLGLDGVYIPSFNHRLNYASMFNLPKKFNIIGSAHNLKEIRTKKFQGCKEIFLSPLFKVKKTKKFLGVIKFNLISYKTNFSFIALGGVNEKNYRKLKLLKLKGFASISWAKKNGLKII